MDALYILIAIAEIECSINKCIWLHDGMYVHVFVGFVRDTLS